MAIRIPMIIGERMKTGLTLVALVSACALAGCAASQNKIGPIFYPPPPQEPHIQFLTGLNNSNDVSGKTQSSFSLILTGKEGETVRKLVKSYGIATHNGKIYVAETSGGDVAVIDPVKGTIDSVKGTTSGLGALRGPINVAFDNDGYMYVADPKRREIVVYDPDGNYARSFGKDLGDNARIVAVAVSPDGDLYALDYGTSRIRVLDRKTGEEKKTMGRIDTPGQSLSRPVNIAVDAAGFIYVTNLGNDKMMKYDRDGNFLTALGGPGDQVGSLIRPKGVAVDDAGRIYVADAGYNLIDLFDDKGNLLIFFGQPGTEAGSLYLPAGVAVTKDNLQLYQKFAAPGFKLEQIIFVVNQIVLEGVVPRVSVFGLGHMEGGGTEGKKEPAAAEPKQGSGEKK